MKASSVVAITTALIACLLVSSVAGDACTFAANYDTAASMTVDALKACYDLIPANTATTGATANVVNAIQDLYSFADISSDSGAPYYINVTNSPFGGLNGNANLTPYFLDLLKRFNKFQDAHFEFAMPYPFANARILTPFCITSAIEGGVQVIKTIARSESYDGIPAPATSTVDALSNQTILTIDGIDALTFIKNTVIGSTFGVHRDPAIQFNAALGDRGFWCERPAGTIPYDATPAAHTYTLSGGFSGSLPNKAVSVTFTDVNDVMSKFNGNKKRATQEKTTRAAKRDYLQFENNDLEWVDGAAGIGAWILKGVTPEVVVIRIDSFQVGSAYDVLQPLARILDDMRVRGVNNAIFDLTRNPGGLAGFAYNTLMWMTPEWENGNFDKLSHAFPPVSYRKTPTTDAMRAANVIPDFFVTKNGVPATGSSFYDSNPRFNVVRGSRTANMTQVGFLDLRADVTSNGQWIQWGANVANTPYYFDRIIVVTDGLCSSACAQFVAKLRHHDRARVIFAGGLKDTPASAATFPGGAKFGYNAFKDQTYSALPAVPAGSYSFNWIETYASCEATQPLDLEHIPVDAYYQNWDIVGFGNIEKAPDAKAVAASTNLWKFAADYFPQMPAGLPRIDRNRPATATNKCPDVTPLTDPATTFSYDCLGVWRDTSECSAECDGGTLSQRFDVIIPGHASGVACNSTNGATRTAPCNTQACTVCQGNLYDYSVCRKDCKKQRIYRRTTGNNCPYADDELIEVPCTNGACVPALAPGNRGAVVPFVHCVVLGSPNVAFLGYFNKNNRTITLPAPLGEIKADSTQNVFTSGSNDRGQPRVFLPGVQPFAWRLEWSDATTWRTESTPDVTLGLTAPILPQCPDNTESLTFTVGFMGVENAPSQYVADIIADRLATRAGLTPGQVTITVAVAPQTLQGGFTLTVKLIEALAPVVSIPEGAANLADDIRASPADFWLTVGAPEWVPGDIVYAVEWSSLVAGFSTLNGTTAEYLDDQQVPIAPTPVLPPNAASQTTIAMALIAIVASLLIVFF